MRSISHTHHRKWSTPLTVRSRAVHLVRGQKEAFRDRDGVEDGAAPLAQHFPLFRDGLHPLTMAHERARPKRQLIELAAEMNERDREPALAIDPNRDRGSIRRARTPAERVSLRQRALLTVRRPVSLWALVRNRDEQEFEWDGLQRERETFVIAWTREEDVGLTRR